MTEPHEPASKSSVPADRDRPPVLIGHRGASGYRPEHTVSAYRLAFESGIPLVEPDIVLSRDGELVIRHDAELGETTDVAERAEFADRKRLRTVYGYTIDGWFVDDFDWAELATLRAKERLPKLRASSAQHDRDDGILRLRDLLDIADEYRGGLVIELKHTAAFLAAHGIDLGDRVIDELSANGWLDGDHNVVIESFEPLVLERLAARDLPVRLVQLLDGQGTAPDLVLARGDSAKSFQWYLSNEGLDHVATYAQGISPAKDIVLERGGQLVADAHRRGLEVFTWTARPENVFLAEQHRTGDDDASWGDYRAEWQRLAASGIDGVFVDHPDLAVDVFGIAH